MLFVSSLPQIPLKMLIPTALLAATLAAYGTYAQSDIPLPPALKNILAANSSLYTYPTQLTQGIIPKAFHSHNDYWRPVIDTLFVLRKSALT